MILVNEEPIKYHLCPVNYMANGLNMYFEHRIAPGGFMIAVLSNDLIGACHRVDDENRQALWAWVKWLYNYAPQGSWGSEQAVSRWLAGKVSDD